MSPVEKLEELKRLGEKRRASIVPGGCLALGDFHSGYYECEFVSPWTISAQNVDAEIAIVLQDWCSSSYLAKAVKPGLREIGHDISLPTNINLKKLLSHIGFEIGDVFGTNAFPYIKSGRMNARVTEQFLCSSFEEFVIPQIRIVKPRIAVLFGKSVYNAAASVYGVRKASSLAEAISSPLQLDGLTYVCSVHPGSKIHIHRGWPQAKEDWNAIQSLLR